MNDINPDMVTRVIIPRFLRSLMKIERERLGLTRKSASKEAKWSSSMWSELEREARNIEPQHWIEAVEVLGLNAEEVVRRLNAFLGKHPSVWLELISPKEYKYCEREITSPRALRSGKVVNVNLNPLRPNLFFELSTFSPEPEKIIEKANALGFFAPRDSISDERPSSALWTVDSPEIRRERLAKIINDLSVEKLGLLERVVDKFQKYSSKDLAHAYQHFSLSVTKR
jgi:hypothetical protein